MKNKFKSYKNQTSYYNNQFHWVNIRHAKNVASALNGKFLNDYFVSISTKHLWECEKFHKFEMSYNSIYNRGNWCPECRKSVQTEMLDYKNPNNWYNINKKVIRAYKPKKKSKRKDKIIQYIKYLQTLGVNVKFVENEPSKRDDILISIGIGIPTDRLYEYSMHHETDQKIKKKSKEKFDEVFG